MTIKEIRSELERRKKSLSEGKERLYGHREEITWAEQAIIGAIELLEQLSAPELVWDRLDCSTEEIDDLFQAKTPAGNYEIWLDDGRWHVQALGLYEIKGSLEEAKAAAQTHWDELYNQIINL